MASTEMECPFAKVSVEEAFGDEVSLFLHCHLRGYDEQGEGKFRDSEYFDKYGAPVHSENSWEEGYHQIEKKLADHYEKVAATYKLDFPLVAGLGGAAHLYKQFHNNEPWNWTGWIPLQKRWYSQNKFFKNRYFLGIRGNEIQNNLWDYDPYEEEKEDFCQLGFSQVEPHDRYRGGYWFYRQAFGRYLHIIALKSHNADPKTHKCRRYNYIVHPLAYRAAIDTIPDNSVDAMQWCIINMPEEEHFGKDEPWGEKCHGLEIFNDYTYFYSYQPTQEGGPYNGGLATGKDAKDQSKKMTYYFWFNTYPLEFAEFMLNSGLARGSYFHTMAANDAYYDRNEEEFASSDPKGGLNGHHKQHTNIKAASEGVEQAEKEKEKKKDKKGKKNNTLVDRLPYKKKTVFGFVTLFDTQEQIRNAVCKNRDDQSCMGLDEAGNIALDYLVEGRYFSSTGIYDLFDCDINHPLPYKIHDQPDPKKICYDIGQLEMVFTFWRIKEKNKDLVWRYTIMLEKLESETQKVVRLETTHGYFKLSNEGVTNLDLRCYEKSHVKWLYFTAIRPKNPQHRAWFHAIRGPAFGQPYLHARLPTLEHRVEETIRQEHYVHPKTTITPTAVQLHHIYSQDSLDFLLQGTPKNKHDIYVYSMQVCPHQQNLTLEPVNEKIRESSDLIPPRILQSVHGYFNLRKKYPTRLNLCASWDSTTLKDRKVYFYIVDGETGDPRPIPDSEKPSLFGNHDE